MMDVSDVLRDRMQTPAGLQRMVAVSLSLHVIVATVMLLVGVGIRMHADGKYMNKMYYHTIDSGLYKFADVFAERKIGDTIQLLSVRRRSRADTNTHLYG